MLEASATTAKLLMILVKAALHVVVAAAVEVEAVEDLDRVSMTAVMTGTAAAGNSMYLEWHRMIAC